MSEGYTYLGNFAVSLGHAIGLECHHCRVSWGGCASECCCPKCWAPKDYHSNGECVCDACQQEQSNDQP